MFFLSEKRILLPPQGEGWDGGGFTSPHFVRHSKEIVGPKADNLLVPVGVILGA